MLPNLEIAPDVHVQHRERDVWYNVMAKKHETKAESEQI